MQLFKRSLAITNDLSLTSIAFPLIGVGLNNYPVLTVIEAILDTCSLFRQENSPLKRVVIVIWEMDKQSQQVNFHLYL